MEKKQKHKEPTGTLHPSWAFLDSHPCGCEASEQELTHVPNVPVLAHLSHHWVKGTHRLHT